LSRRICVHGQRRTVLTLFLSACSLTRSNGRRGPGFVTRSAHIHRGMLVCHSFLSNVLGRLFVLGSVGSCAVHVVREGLRLRALRSAETAGLPQASANFSSAVA
jgi:hypothetical protein